MTDWARVVRAVAPHADPRLAGAVADHADTVFSKYKITTPERQSDFVAHVLVESAGLTKTEENLNYSAQRLTEVWPARFPTLASAVPYAHNPKALAIKVYGGRMGNRPGTDDGWVMRGEGLLQATGRDNISRLARTLGITPEVCAHWLSDPAHMLECAAALYVMLGCLPFADRGDIRGSTQRVNGGTNGLAERTAARSRVLRALRPAPRPAMAVGFADVPAADEVAAPADVKAAQRRLKALGYFPGAADGNIGPAMAGTLTTFQFDNDLPKTGELDAATRAALASALTSERAIPDARAAVTVDDLRAKGSETIKATDEAEQGLSVKVAGGTAAVGVLTEAVSSASAVKDSVSTLPDLVQFAVAHAALIAVVIVIAVVWYERQAIVKALNRIREARRVDHATGANMGR